MTKHYPREGTFCSVEECTRQACGPGSARGYCSKHYQSFRMYGRTTIVQAPRGSGHTNKTLGYREIYINGIKKYEHISIAEKALEKKLPKGAIVHHVTENQADNNGPWKLVVCPNQAYHRLIHDLMKKKGITFETGWPNGSVGEGKSREPLPDLWSNE